MREQIGYPYQPVIKRRSLTTAQEAHVRQHPASPHRAGHFAGLHPEDQPFITGYDSDEDDTYTQVPARTVPRSAIRYRPTQQQAQPKKRVHWLMLLGIAIFVMILGWIALTAIGNWWQGVINNITYGMPRTYQTDANVGHNGRMSHFIAVNLAGDVEVIETQRGHPEASKIYTVITMSADQAAIPVTISFQDLNGDGKIDALIHYGGTEIPMYNNGTGFQSQPQGR